MLPVDPKLAIAPHYKQIQLGPGVGGPEVAILRRRAQTAVHLLQDESFPGRAGLGVGEEFLVGRDPEERMEEPAVSKVDFGRTHLSLGNVRMPRRQRPYNESTGTMSGSIVLIGIRLYRSRPTHGLVPLICCNTTRWRHMTDRH